MNHRISVRCNKNNEQCDRWKKSKKHRKQNKETIQLKLQLIRFENRYRNTKHKTNRKENWFIFLIKCRMDKWWDNGKIHKQTIMRIQNKVNEEYCYIQMIIKTYNQRN